MEEVIKQIQQLHNTLKQKVSLYDSKQNDLTKREADLNARQRSIEEYAKTLESREVEVKKVESVQALEMRGREALAEAERIKEEARREVERKAKEVKDIRSTIANERRQAEEMKSNAEAQRDSLKRQREELEKEKANYRQNILEELLKKTKG